MGTPVLTPFTVQPTPDRLLAAARQTGQSAAIWRLPHTTAVHFLVDLSGESVTPSVEIEALPPGFLFSSFAGQVRFLHADLHFVFEGEKMKEALGSGRSFPVPEAQFRQLAATVVPLGSAAVVVPPPDPADQAAFLQLVSRGIAEIWESDLQKVVLSRRKAVQLPSDFSPVAAFRALSQRYPHAFVSLLLLPDGTFWLGASPEILVSRDAAGVFRTMALAGTQAAQPDTPPAAVQWGGKEIEEQALVSRYIINCFKEIRLREFDEEGPRTVVAGNLVHLRTDFAVDTHSVNFPELTGVMLQLLHPTSAVCGMPKPAALAFIEQYEGYDRQLYSGYLGPVNISGEINLFVNLRCMQGEGQQGWVYAGGGVTAASLPEKEWQETEIKCATLLSGLTLISG